MNSWSIAVSRSFPIGFNEARILPRVGKEILKNQGDLERTEDGIDCSDLPMPGPGEERRVILFSISHLLVQLKQEIGVHQLVASLLL